MEALTEIVLLWTEWFVEAMKDPDIDERQGWWREEIFNLPKRCRVSHTDVVEKSNLFS